MTDDLHRPLYVPDLIVNALNQTPERPLLQLAGGPMLTVGQVRDATSQFVQALQGVLVSDHRVVGSEQDLALTGAGPHEPDQFLG